MPDYKLKSEILNNHYKELGLYSKCNRIINLFRREESNITFEEYKNALCFRHMLSENLGSKKVKEISRLCNSKVKRVIRLRERITNMLLNFECLFLTLTFTDKTLLNTSAKTRRTLVSRFLRQFNVPYVGNIDFGKMNGREHYHALIAIGKIDYHLWTYGAINGLKVRNDIDYTAYGEIKYTSIQKIAKYIAKLTNHAIKETTKRSVLIYSREKRVKVNDTVEKT